MVPIRGFEIARLLRRFLLIWLLSMLLLGGGLFLLYANQTKSREALLRSNERATVENALQALLFRLATPASDALYLANQVNLQNLLNSGLAAQRHTLATDYLAFAASRPWRYDQIRYLNEQGREVVRVNLNDNQPTVVPDRELQDKGDRYYIRETLALPANTVYMSPFDLNVEHGQVETPRKPMIRFASRVVDGHGRPSGLVVLNYLGQPLLERLRQASRPDNLPLWLVNGNGDWMLGPEVADEWAFMYPDQGRANMMTQYPAVWRALNGGQKSGQLMRDGGLLTYALFEPSQIQSKGVRLVTNGTHAPWFIVGYLPPETLVAYAAPLQYSYWSAYGVLGVAFAIAIWFLGWATLRRQQADEATRTSEARFRALLESAPDGILISDREGRILLANVQIGRLFGQAPEALIGKTVETLMPERFRHNHVNHRSAYAASPVRRQMGAGQVLCGLRQDGSEFPVGISLSAIDTDQGRLVFSAIRDISDHLETEQRIQTLNHDLSRQNAALSSLNQELEAFSYSVSHDLRAPLRSINGFGQILQEDYAAQLDAEGRSYLSRIRAATERMGHLIDDMITLSRVTRAEVHMETVNLSDLATEVIEALRKSDPQREVAVHITPGLTAHGDPRLLRIALENLLGNAWKFTAHTDGARIEFGQTLLNGNPVYYVRDNGAGFDMTYVDKLFRAFQRLHAASVFPGTGIGLATVQRVIHKHGGRVWAEGEENQGAVFHFTFET